jgi:hypothetical protein
MSSNPNGHKILMEAITRFFTEDNWRFDVMEDRPVLTMGFQGENGSWRCFAQVKEEQEQFVFYSVLTTNAPMGKLAQVAEYLTRANYGLILGNFELDFHDGEVRYKTSVDISGGELTQDMIRTLVYVNVLMMDRYLPGLMAVAYAGGSPADEIAKAESA